jgi:hypothetical protein
MKIQLIDNYDSFLINSSMRFDLIKISFQINILSCFITLITLITKTVYTYMTAASQTKYTYPKRYLRV